MSYTIDEFRKSFDRKVWIKTYTGKKINPLRPDPDDIDIRDIAHALSNLCRFTGHCKKFYSVGQHCLLASYIVSFPYKLAALLHDAAEAYLNDIAAPLKNSQKYSNVKGIETLLLECIFQKFNVPVFCNTSKVINEVDSRLLVTEAEHFGLYDEGWSVKSKPYILEIEPKSPEIIETVFLNNYRMLTGDKSIEYRNIPGESF